MSHSLWTHGLYSSWNSPGQNTGVGSRSLLQEIFPTQGLNLGLSHCRQILYQLNHQGSPGILEQVAYPFSSDSCQPRNQTRDSCIAGRFFTSWATSEAQNKFNEDFKNDPHQKKKKKKKKKKKRNPQTFELSFYLPTFNNMLWCLIKDCRHSKMGAEKSKEAKWKAHAVETLCIMLLEQIILSRSFFRQNSKEIARYNTMIYNKKYLFGLRSLLFLAKSL